VHPIALFFNPTSRILYAYAKFFTYTLISSGIDISPFLFSLISNALISLLSLILKRSYNFSL